MKKVAIIGAGALGLTLAGLLKDNFNVTLIEKNNKVGKKILASGNGKCNFTNTGDYTNKYNNCFANKIINKFTSIDNLNYFDKLGLAYRIDKENRAYPLSESSMTILDILKSNLKGVRILLDSKVNFISKNNKELEVFYNDIIEEFDYVVCCSGSKASNLGSDDCYSYLKKSDIELTELKPSLTPLIVKENLKVMSGVRTKCLVSLFKDNKLVIKEYGEVLFKDNSLGGIVILNMSSYINRQKGNYTISLDLTYDCKNKIDDKKLIGLVHPKVKEYLEKNKLTDLKNLKFEVINTDKFINSQVVSGGVKLELLNDDLSLKEDNRTYLGGEAIDIDGVCGGYNLQFAFSCAHVIADSLLKRK